MVVLKRLADAIAEGDRIYAVIRGTAINNDGARKVGFTAPSVEGQAKVIAEALAVAEVDPETIGYVEAHGTGTPLGDPVEVRALKEAYGRNSVKQSYCAIGSVKSNIGHLDTGAGVAGLIKTVQALRHKQIPPTLHYERANPKLEIEGSAFYVSDRLREWERDGSPRRAGVSSFGMGGTNAHVILEEWEEEERGAESGEEQVLVWSARNERALRETERQLGEWLGRSREEVKLADVTYTLQQGRRELEYRGMVVSGAKQEAAEALQSGAGVVRGRAGDAQMVFLFPGQGAQYAGMGRELYERERVFRSELDGCAESAVGELGLDLREVLYEDPGRGAELLRQTRIAQPALYAVEYALAKQWESWGVKPAAMLGHSLGEYVVAAMAGLFSRDDGMRLVVRRGGWMEQAGSGRMLAAEVSEEDARRWTRAGVWLAAVNGKRSCVLGGAIREMEQVREEMEGTGVKTQWVGVEQAYHTGLMEGIAGEVAREVERVERGAVKVRWISCVTGDWIDENEVRGGEYWGRQLREPVRFWAGIERLLGRGEWAWVEAGPGRGLSAQVKGGLEGAARRRAAVTSGLRAEQEWRGLMQGLGRMWVAGVPVEWTAVQSGEKRRKTSVPGYPLERQRYWIEGVQAEEADRRGKGKQELERWFYAPVWKRSSFEVAGEPIGKQRWAIFGEPGGWGELLARVAMAGGAEVEVIAERAGYEEVCAGWEQRQWWPEKVVHAWLVSEALESHEVWQERGLYSLLKLGRALGARRHEVELIVISSGMAEVTGGERLQPEKATVLGACKVLPQEYEQLRCRVLDIEGHTMEAELVAGEIGSGAGESIAWRNGHRWEQVYEHLAAGQRRGAGLLRERGVYLITGGLGGVGLTAAEYLAEKVQARLILTGRRRFPGRGEWEGYEGDERVRVQIERLRRMESRGAEVLVLQADVSDAEAMRAALEQARQRFGAIHGVIHAAGEIGPDTLRSIGETDYGHIEQQFRAKIEGVRVLAEQIEGADFYLLCSSLSTVLGGLGYCGYAAANAYLDAFAEQRAGAWMSVDWDGWQWNANAGHSWAGILAAEGLQAFERLFQMGRPGRAPARVLVSVRDLEQRLNEWVRRTVTPSVPVTHSRPAALEADYVGPRNDIERRVAAIWSDVIGVTPIGIHDNFFELGGHSLLAMRVVNLLREEFQIPVSIHALLERSSVEDLARWIDTELLPQPTTVAAQCLIEINAGGAIEPLFLIHPADGSVYCFSDIARFLPSEQPIYGLQARGLEDALDPCRSIREMADAYIRAMRARQPHGPYYVGGSCMGGCIAFEISQALSRMGEDVRLLAFFDTPGPGQLPYNFKDNAEFFVFLFEKDMPLSVEYLRQLSEDDQVRYVLEQISKTFPSETAAMGEEQAHRFLRVYKANTDALFAYDPAQYAGSGHVAFFRAEERDRYNPPNPERSWLSLVGDRLELHSVPGSHRTMTQMPHAKVLAEKLSICLQRTRSAGTHG